MEKEVKKSSGGAVLITAIILLLLFGVILFIFNKKGYLSFDKVDDNTTNNQNYDNDNNNIDTFSNEGNGYGTATVTGYAYKEERTDIDTNEKYSYVFFKIINSDSSNFMSYINDWALNSFISDRAIGLGCLDNNVISYSNASDALGYKGHGFKLSEEDTNKLLSSSESNPLTVKLEKLKLTSGSGADKCYSHITNINIVK